LLENERKPTLRLACEQFKEACPSWRSLEVIGIDKDFTEMAVLEEEFPSVRVLLCQFHVVKYLQEEVSKVKYELTSWSKKQMKQLFSLLVSAPTQKNLDGVIPTMELSIKPDSSRPLWMDYFNRNWLSCKERWSSVYRGNVPHMGNTTNNRYCCSLMLFVFPSCSNLARYYQAGVKLAEAEDSGQQGHGSGRLCCCHPVLADCE
jgi:hypothetical protein